MTKQDILKMNTRQEVMKALAENRELWDRETDEHLRQLAEKELLKEFGSKTIIVKLNKKAPD